MEVLSVAANVASLADILHRASIATYERFRALKDAPDNIRSLLVELQLFTQIIGDIYVFADEFKRSPFALQDNQDLTALSSVLDQCQIEVTHLQSLAQAAASSPADGWLTKGKNRLSWVLDAQKVEDARRQFDRHRCALKTALSLVGRCDCY